MTEKFCEVIELAVSIGDSCKLYKKCKICGEYKYLREFPPTGGKNNNFSRRKSYCRACKDRKHERTLEPIVEYKYDTSLLDVSKDIKIRGRSSKNYKYESIISYDKAKRLVEENAAGIVNSTLIHHFFNKNNFKEFILARDKFTCHYCSFYGDTVDHKIPKSKGGLSTPSNCVCACFICNQEKNDVMYEDYLDILQ